MCVRQKKKTDTIRSGNLILILLVFLLTCNIAVRLILTGIKPEIRIEEIETARVSMPVNINTASEEILQHLPGIGPVKAKLIIEYREKHGKFSSIDEIKNIKGFGEKSVRQLSGLMQVSP